MRCVPIAEECVALLQQGYTAFEPHFMHRKCDTQTDTQECRDNCIHHGRYCAFDLIDANYSAHYKPRQVSPRLPVTASEWT